MHDYDYFILIGVFCFVAQLDSGQSILFSVAGAFLVLVGAFMRFQFLC